MRQLQVEAEGTTSASPGAVWALVADANSYPHWGPWSEGGYRPSAAGPSRNGSVQWFRYGRTVSVEKILEIEEPRRLAYAVIDGLPVKNYRAELTLRPTLSGGTAVRWVAAWDSTFLGKLARNKLQKVYLEVVKALIAAADRSCPQTSELHPDS